MVFSFLFLDKTHDFLNFHRESREEKKREHERRDIDIDATAKDPEAVLPKYTPQAKL